LNKGKRVDSIANLPFKLRTFGGQIPGPRLLITAGVHGDELLPVLAVRELIRQFETSVLLRSKLRGSLTLIPVVNPSAHVRHHRCGEDHLDLARTCPGRADGSSTERLGFAISREIEAADYYIDLHTGGSELCVLPLSGYMLHPDSQILERQRRLALAFQLPLVWGTSADLPGRTLSVARDASVPAIYVEYLGAHRELREIVSQAARPERTTYPLVEGCLNVMRHLHMLDQPLSSSMHPEIIEDWRPQSGHLQVSNPAPISGFLKLKVELGQQISKGDLLAEIYSEADNQVQSVESHQTGRVVVVRDLLTVRQGDAIAVIAESSARS
jgi:predicted deacylase